jgi:hypothetical protein
MRKTILLSTLLILAGCGSTPQPPPPAAQPEIPPAALDRQPDSPIVVTDGSIHYRKHNNFIILDSKTAVAEVAPGKTWSLAVQTCTGSPGCKDSPATLTSPWTVTLHDTKGTKVATLTYNGYEAVMLQTDYDLDSTHLQKPGPDSEYDHGHYNDGAPGIAHSQPSVRVANAKYGGNDYKCPALGSQKCQIWFTQR